MTGLFDDVYSDYYGTSTPDGFRVEVDWDGDGDFASYLEDVTPHTLREYQISLSYGRDQSSALSATTAGSGGFTLDNRSRMYSPRNVDSPLYPNVRPARQVKITRTVSGATYTLFRGHTDQTPLRPDVATRTVSLSLLDSLADFRGFNLSTPLYRGLRTGEAIGYVLDACGWPADRRDLDPGATLIRWWWEDGTDALTALERIVQSEGTPSYVSMGTDDEVIFRDRHHRLTRAASLTSQGTWRDQGQIEPVMAREFAYDEAWQSIVNSASKTVEVRAAQNVQPVWTSDSTLTFTAGQQRIVNASATDPFFDAVTPVAGTDFTQVSGIVTARLLRTSGGSVGIVLTADVGGPAVITGLQLRANPVTVAYAVEVSSADSTSVAEYGSRSLTTDLPWCGPEDAQAVLDLTVAQRAQPLAVVSARFMVGVNPGRCAAVLARDLSDRVTVIEPESGLSGEFFVESIRHELTGEHDHAVMLDVEAAPVGVSPVFRFDTAGAGFGDGKFGDGTDDPANMFRFDGTVGQRFDEAVFCT